MREGGGTTSKIQLAKSEQGERPRSVLGARRRGAAPRGDGGADRAQKIRRAGGTGSRKASGRTWADNKTETRRRRRGALVV